MKVSLRRFHKFAPEIRPGAIRRDWMDATYNKHAYRCLALTGANCNGWEVVLQQDVTVVWDGGNCIPRITDGEIYEDRQIANCNKIGIIDFHIGWAINPPEGYGVWITGAPNHFVDGATPLAANMPAWWPDDESFLWKINKIGEPVTFRGGEPFAFFMIYDRSVMPQIEFESSNAWEDEEFIGARIRYSLAKAAKAQDEPWTWMNGIRTGLNEKGQRIGPEFTGHPTLQCPPTRVGSSIRQIG